MCSSLVQGGPLAVVNGVITPLNGLINGYITALIALVMGVINPVITGRGPTLYSPDFFFYVEPVEPKNHPIQNEKSPKPPCLGSMLISSLWPNGQMSLTQIQVRDLLYGFFLKQNITPIQKRCAKAAFEYFFLPRFIGFQFCSNFVIFPSAESIIWPVLRDE